VPATGWYDWQKISAKAKRPYHFTPKATPFAFGGVYPKLIDTREAVHYFSDDDIMTLGARAQAYAFYESRGPIAIVAASLESIEYMRRFINLAAGERPIRLFAAVEQARAWLHQLKGDM